MASLISFSGIASGIDTASLIKATLDSQRQVRIQPLQTQITSLTDTDDSLGSLRTLLDKFKSAVDKFRLVNGGALSKNGTSSDETKVSATASNGATNATYSVSVGQLARAATFSFNDRFSDTDTAINSGINDAAPAADRTISVDIGSGSDLQTVDIALTSGTTSAQFVSQFNNATTKAQASLVNVGTTTSPSYAVVINSLNQGSDKGQLSVSVGSAVSGAGSFSGSTLTQAQNAQFGVSGISGTITRQSNDVTDVISNLTLSLRGTGSATVSVSDDTTSSTQNVQDFVTAYNDILKYVTDNNSVTRNEDGKEVSNVFGPLAKTSVDNSVVSSLRSALSSVSLSGNTVNTLADLGITTQRDGTLKFDTTVFSNATLSDSGSSATLLQNLGETLGAVDGTIAQFSRFGGLIDAQVNSNKSQITSLSNRVTDIEKFLAQEEQSMTARFSRLESLIGKLNSQQNSLSSLGM